MLSLWDNPIKAIAEQVYLKNYAAASEIANSIRIDASTLRNFIIATFQSCSAYGAMLAESTPHFLKDDIFGTSATYLVEALNTDISTRIQQQVLDAIAKVQQDPSLLDDEEEKPQLILISKAPSKEDYIKEFVTFADGAEGLVQMVSGLHTSRLATWGFTLEAEYLGIETYKLEAVLDSKTSNFCKHIAHGKIFQVADAKRKVVEVLNAPTADAKFLQPWVRGTKANLAELSTLTAAELTARGLHIPPFHPFCRTLCMRVDSKLVLHMPVKVPDNTFVTPVPHSQLQLEKALEPLSAAMANLLKTKATKKAIANWNRAVVTDASQTISKLTNKPLQEVTEGMLDAKVSIVAVKDGSVTLKGKADVDGGTQEFSYNFNPVLKQLRVNFVNFVGQKDPRKSFANQMLNILDVAKMNEYAKVVMPVQGESTFIMALLDMSFSDMIGLQKSLLKKLDNLNTSFPLLLQDDYEALRLMISSPNLEGVGLQSIAKYPLQLGNKFIGELLFKGVKNEAVVNVSDAAKMASMEAFLSTLW
ncbi:MAG: hypothetical protein RR280_04415 [Bacteroidaceae bacterium]